jgi:hypothetical protein
MLIECAKKKEIMKEREVQNHNYLSHCRAIYSLKTFSFIALFKNVVTAVMIRQ